MSRYGFFTCMDCKVMFWLGKAVYHEDGGMNYFKLGEVNDPPNTQRPELNRVVWKMLADHIGHPLRVVLDESDDFDQIADFIEVGGDEIKDVSIDQYLGGWKG